ncbi:MAG: cysteine--tRNA ligase [Candidatus Pacebacteria bacterium]|nr:cysteine--tRNA ligase [Candidatus Paceibacterota bacterium]
MFKLYNTLSRGKEVFRPRKDKKVNLFVCGITPYDFSHIGHARTYVVFDVITKYLREKEFDVFYLQNITDIDDKIIKRAKEKKISPQKLARDFEKEYLKDMKALGIDSVTKYARATEHIKEIQSQVKRLLEKGFAYQIEDGIYYDISKFKDYGKLSKRTVLQAEDAVSRIDAAKEKRNRGDFCLWKRSKTGEPKWKGPWFLGRPGWHIEDTAITEKYFGFQYDIHGGAKDLIFPHHEAEIAQMEAISKRKPMVRYWLHSGFLTVRNQKMAKSLGNFITIRDFLKKNSPRILRFFIIKTHYQSPIDYQEKAILQTKIELEKIDEFIEKLNMIKSQKENKKRFAKSLVLRTEKEFRKAMDDDFNTPKALASIFNLVNKGNSLIAQNKLSPEDAREILKRLSEIDEVFNFIFWKRLKEKIPKEILKLVKEREEFRKTGQWQRADEIRKKIKQMGYWVEDTKKGPKIKKL